MATVYVPASGRTTANTSTSGSDATRPRVVDDLIEIMSEKEVPFLKLIGIDGEAYDQNKIEWMTDELLAEKDVVVDNPLAIGATTLTLGANANVQIGSLLKIGSEVVRVTAVSTADTTTCTIVRAQLGTSAAEHAKDTEVLIYSIASDEGTSAPRKATTLPGFAYNYYQIFKQAFKISWKQEDSPMYGNAADYDTQLEKCFRELNIKLEHTAIRGIRHDGTTLTGQPMTMGGLDSMIGTNTTSLNSAALEEKDILDELQDLYYLVGPANMGDTILCGAWAKRKIADWYAPRVNQTRKEKIGGVTIDVIETDFGDINVKMLPRIPTDTLYIVKLDQIKVHPFKGHGRWNDSELASDGDYRLHMLYGCYTLKVKNEKCMAKISGFSTTA